MFSLKDHIAPLESRLKSVPMRIGFYQDLPFAILPYDPTDVWELRREIKSLAWARSFRGPATFSRRSISGARKSCSKKPSRRSSPTWALACSIPHSKSRRKVPIYPLLQSTKQNYAIRIYYHQLDKDPPFKALVNYVEPKIRLEGRRLETLRAHKSADGGTSKEAKRLAKEAERQEDFLCESRDFEDKLRRAANLHPVPDLNDGVVLNIAPLHELVPWKEATNYWEELREGKYEWSSIGKQLREKELVKC